MKNIKEIKNYLIKEIDQNELVRKKHKNICKILNYTENLLILFSTVTEYGSNSAFASLIGITLGIKSSAVGIKICEITAVIKNYKSLLTKKMKKFDEIVLLAKNKLNIE